MAAAGEDAGEKSSSKSSSKAHIRQFLISDRVKMTTGVGGGEQVSYPKVRGAGGAAASSGGGRGPWLGGPRPPEEEGLGLLGGRDGAQIMAGANGHAQSQMFHEEGLDFSPDRNDREGMGLLGEDRHSGNDDEEHDLEEQQKIRTAGMVGGESVFS